ncbi:MAG: prephenate dehydratase [Acidimicrobiaceae bacterium]|nr:prephenate dehydratase [Acidimicrobiaceae bacterium]
MSAVVTPASRVAFLGPRGTFTEEALRTQADLAAATLVPLPSFVEVLTAVSDGDADYGLVALENSIEGTVSVAIDQLVFDRDLLISREIVLPITQNLIARPGVELTDIRRVVSFPHALAQCRSWLGEHLPGVVEVAATSTAEAVHQVAEADDRTIAAVANGLAAQIYHLEVIAADIEDHPDNATRFVLVAPPSAGIPAPTGHDKTSIVCFQPADRPGSLHGILGQFSARDINLVKLESRPTKQALGEYCFVIDFEGHIADEVVADAMRNLHATLRWVKYLGSYPVAGDHEAIRSGVQASWEAADKWIADLRSRISD